MGSDCINTSSLLIFLHHRCPGASQGRRVPIAFHSVAIPLMSSQISRSQV